MVTSYSQPQYIMNLKLYQRIITGKWQLVDIEWANSYDEIIPDLKPTNQISDYKFFLESKSLFKKKIDCSIVVWPGKLNITSGRFQYVAEFKNTVMHGYGINDPGGVIACRDILLGNGERVDIKFTFSIQDSKLDHYFHCANNYFDILNNPVHSRI